ncbi:MAG TPA: hypothetical protein ENO23_11560, partial [Alphaproteobacteria bacterium]|nr:hypothetical protein [Alphaproteobacteria bacterium]
MNGRGPVRRLFRLGVRKPEAVEEVAWEIDHHLAEVRERLVEEGWDPVEAAAEAERRFGRMEAYRRSIERIERRRGRMERWSSIRVAMSETLASAVRGVVRQPGVALAVTATLGIGIGANAAMFSILDRLFFQPPAHVVDHQ